MNKDQIKKEADAFFEWHSDERNYVTTTSMLLFAGVIAEMARAEEREDCAKVCENERLNEQIEDESDISYNLAIKHAANAIRMRSSKADDL